jgi:hypothetical protein
MRRNMNQVLTLLVGVILMVTVTGCSYIFYPRADEFAEKAKGATGVETLINLTTMLAASAQAARGGRGYDQPLDDLHNQFHALHDAMCGVTREQAETPAYAMAVTVNKEMRTIFKRLWKFKDQQPQRDDHLDRFVMHVQALRGSLQAIK